MTEESELRKEVFAWFGGAAYAAQCFEYELCILILLHHRLTNPNLTIDELDHIDLKLSRKTLGALLRELKSYLVIRPEFEKMLNEYLDKRNFLMHHFFSEHAHNLQSPAGCQKMIKELQATYNSLKEADAIAQEMSRNVRKHLGISEQEVEAWIQAHM